MNVTNGWTSSAPFSLTVFCGVPPPPTPSDFKHLILAASVQLLVSTLPRSSFDL